VIRNTNDGFEIAQKDLELRGPGEVLGTRQTGMMQLRVADLIRDADLAPAVQSLAQRLLDERSAAADQVVERWLGGSSDYVNV
jgi:ATP-dependent DNA helicase RecG